MNISNIMDLLSENNLNQLGDLYQVDKINHKITGKFILKSFVFCILKGYNMTLRSLEIVCNNNINISKLLKTKDIKNKCLDHSSLGKRLRTIDVGYFKQVYNEIVAKYSKKFSKAEINKLHRFDSTIITLSGKLLKDGLNLGGKTSDRHIKISFGLKDSIPSSVRFCIDQSESSEDVALVKAINEAKVTSEDILLFDRGIAKAATFMNLSKAEQYFITRVNVHRNYTLVKNNEIKESAGNNLKIISDEIVNLYGQNKQKINWNLRLIKAKTINNKELWFLTNVLYLTPEEVGETYKKRWDIEVFFKFLKQHLQFKHFISYNSNGMTVYIYCILIAAILLIMFKILNKLTEFKSALLKFTLALEKEIIRE